MESINRETHSSTLPLRAFFFVLGFYALAAAALMTEGTRPHSVASMDNSSVGVTATLEP